MDDTLAHGKRPPVVHDSTGGPRMPVSSAVHAFAKLAGVRKRAAKRLMTGYTWPSEESSDVRIRAWADTVRRLPVGARVAGRVVGRQPFGVFVTIDGVPDALGLAEIIGLSAGSMLPALNAHVTGEVIGHAEHNHQARLRLSEATA